VDEPAPAGADTQAEVGDEPTAAYRPEIEAETAVDEPTAAYRPEIEAETAVDEPTAAYRPETAVDAPAAADRPEGASSPAVDEPTAAHSPSADTEMATDESTASADTPGGVTAERTETGADTGSGDSVDDGLGAGEPTAIIRPAGPDATIAGAGVETAETSAAEAAAEASAETASAAETDGNGDDRTAVYNLGPGAPQTSVDEPTAAYNPEDDATTTRFRPADTTSDQDATSGISAAPEGSTDEPQSGISAAPGSEPTITPVDAEPQGQAPADEADDTENQTQTGGGAGEDDTEDQTQTGGGAGEEAQTGSDDEEPTEVQPLDDNRGRPTTATGDEPTVLASGVQLTPTWVAPDGTSDDDEAQRTMVIQPSRQEQQKGSSDGFDEPTQRFSS
jgi:hypothetical protein